ncbi:histidine kinase [Roseovarius spongiae]|uniref:histidine kinase n=1 Tax=Roseovarius spongiae TaxID=2320272 RepID=A0A3A8AUX0_9RHOB|nr:histidine kinase dimerization/phosphoacceptor domain -containing protein [Roseovarius spongiae]RKF14868.1 histidine kinase [Roseovarius spongiae]
MPWRRAARVGGRAGLAVQIIAILSIAILPLALISVYQSSKMLRESRNLSRTALAQHTESMTADERELIQSAIGAARAISSATVVLRNDPEICRQVLEKLVARDARYIFAGYITEQNELRCTSSGQRGAIDKADMIADSVADHEPRVITHSSEVLSGRMVLSVSVPLVAEGEFLGAVWIAIPYEVANALLEAPGRAVELLIFGARGEILATEAFDDERRTALPAGMELSDLARDVPQTFRRKNRAGLVRDFAIVPIVDGVVYGLGSWEPREGNLLPGVGPMISVYFPLLMWLVAMAVAYVGINRLAVRHVYRLRNWMRMYTAGRTDFSEAKLQNAPEEFEIVAEAFRRMTRELSEHERRREESVAEKTILLKEIHHRVKNNLQLISSIMNMQIRKADSLEARNLLRRVQDRVMALAAIHRTLYAARELSVVPADELLDSIVSQLVKVGSLDEDGQHISISTHFSPAEISADQAVPLCLLATEAAMNAVKFVGHGDESGAWIQIVLHHQGDREYCLSVINSRGRQPTPEENPDAGTGLGSRLIASFAAQLDGTLEINDLPDRYEMHVTFTAESESESAPVDY